MTAKKIETPSQTPASEPKICHAKQRAGFSVFLVGVCVCVILFILNFGIESKETQSGSCACNKINAIEIKLKHIKIAIRKLQ